MSADRGPEGSVTGDDERRAETWKEKMARDTARYQHHSSFLGNDPRVLWYCCHAEAWLKQPCRHKSCESRGWH
jgi:hypothetical protein